MRYMLKTAGMLCVIGSLIILFPGIMLALGIILVAASYWFPSAEMMMMKFGQQKCEHGVKICDPCFQCAMVEAREAKRGHSAENPFPETEERKDRQ